MDIDNFLDEYTIEEESLIQQEKLNKAKLSEDFIDIKDTTTRVTDYATNIATKAIEGIELLAEAGLTKVGLEDEETFAQSVESYRSIDQMTHGIDATTGEAEESLTTDLLSGAIPLVGGAKLTGMAAKGALGKTAQDVATTQLARDAQKSALRVIAETEGAYGAIGALQGVQTAKVDTLTGKPVVDTENIGSSLAEGFAFNAALGAVTRAGEIKKAVTKEIDIPRKKGTESAKKEDIDYWIDEENNFNFSKINTNNEIKKEAKEKYNVDVKDVKDDIEFAADSAGNIYIDKKLKEEKDKNPTAKEVYKILIDHEVGHIDRFKKEKGNVDVVTEEALRHLDTLAQLTELYSRAKDKDLVKDYYKKALDAFEEYTYNIKDKEVRERFYDAFDAVSEIAREKELPKELKEEFITDVIKENLGDVSYKGSKEADRLHAFKNEGEPPEWFNEDIAERIKEKVGQAVVERQLREKSNQSGEFGADYGSYDVGGDFNINAKLVADFIEKAYKYNVKKLKEEYRQDDEIVKWLSSEEGKQFIIETVIEDLGNYMRSGRDRHFFVMRDGETVFVKGVNINKLYKEMLKQAKKYSREDKVLDILEKTQGDKIKKSHKAREKIIEDYRRYLQNKIYDYMEEKKIRIEDIGKDKELKKLVEKYEELYNKILTTKRKKELLKYIDDDFAKNYESIKKTIPGREELNKKKERVRGNKHLEERGKENKKDKAKEEDAKKENIKKEEKKKQVQEELKKKEETKEKAENKKEGEKGKAERKGEEIKTKKRIEGLKKANIIDELDIKFAKRMVKARTAKLKEEELFKLLYTKATEKRGLLKETPFDDIKLLPEKIEINKKEEIKLDNEERGGKGEQAKERNVQEEIREEYSNKFVNEEEGRFELRYVRGIDKLYKKLRKFFGEKRNKYKIEEGMPYIGEVVDKITKGEKVKGVAIKGENKAYAFANTKALQAKAAIHEFMHLVYKDKKEAEIRKITDNVFNYLITHKEFRERIGYIGEIPKHAIVEKDAIRYLLGNKDMRQILFGKQEIIDIIDDANAITSNILNRVFKLAGGDVLVNNFKKVEKRLPKAVFDLVQEVKGVSESNTVRVLTDYKKSKKAIHDKLIETINKNIDDVLEKGITEKELKIIFQSGLFRDVTPEKLIAKYGDDLTDAWRELRKKFNKKIEIIEDSSEINALKNKKIRTYEELKKEFKDDWEEALELIVLNILKKNNSFYILADKKKLETAKRIFELFDDIKTDLDDHSRVIGYTPYILETSYDLKVAFSEDMRYRLEEQGYKSEDGFLYYKRVAEENITSEVLDPINFNKKAGFNITAETIEELKKIKEFFAGKDIRIRRRVDAIEGKGEERVRYEITYQPKIEDIKSITSIKTDAKSLILKTYQKMLKEQFNKFDLPGRILNKKEILFDEKDGIFSDAKKEGYIKFEKDEIEFLNKNLSDKTGIKFDEIYVRKDVKDLIIGKEVLPKNETLKKIVKIQKGLIARLKWNLTGVSVSAYNNAIMGGLLATGYFGVNPKHIIKVLKDTKRDYEVFKKLKEKFIRDNNIDKKDIEGFFRKYYDKNLFVEIMLDGKMASLFDDVDVLIGKATNYTDYVLYEELKKLEKKYGLFNTEKMFKLLKDVTIDRDSKFGKILSTFYGDIDLFSRAISYRFLKERVGKEKAIKMVNDMFVDYSIQSRHTTSALDLTVAPFLAWTLRMQGGIFRLIKERPVNFASMLALYMGANAILDEEKYYNINDEFAGDLRIDSWFIHKAFMDDMILNTNIIAQLYEGKIGKVIMLTAMPKTFEEAYAVWKGSRNKMELLGFNFSYGFNKKEILKRENYKEDKGISFR